MVANIKTPKYYKNLSYIKLVGTAGKYIQDRAKVERMMLVFYRQGSGLAQQKWHMVRIGGCKGVVLHMAEVRYKE